MSLNKVMLIGNVGKDPEVRYLEGNSPAGQGRKVATFTLATSERFKDRSGETRENTEWHNIVVRRDLVPFVEKWVRKGSSLFVEGKIRTRSYDDQAGVKRYVTEIHADKLEFYSSGARPDAGQTTGQTTQPAASTVQQPVTPVMTVTQQPTASSTGAYAESTPQDDLPF